VKPSIFTCACALALAALLLAAPVAAQDLELPEDTTEQRWQRLANRTADLYAALVALGDAQGMSAEEVGAWVGEFYAEKAWLTSPDAPGLAVFMHRNLMGMPAGETQVLQTTPDSVTVRFNRPIDSMMFAGDQRLGVPAERIAVMLRAIDHSHASAVGIELERQVASDHDVLTLTSLYGNFEVANNDIRWARSAFLGQLNWLQLLSVRMKSGMTAREIGEADAELYAPTWTAETPWQLLRGMVWNEMSHPDAKCEVLSASADEIKARCREFGREVTEANQEEFGVTPEDALESDLAFRSGVADYLGMSWSQELVDGWVLITVSRSGT